MKKGTVVALVAVGIVALLALFAGAFVGFSRLLPEGELARCPPQPIVEAELAWEGEADGEMVLGVMREAGWTQESAHAHDGIIFSRADEGGGRVSARAVLSDPTTFVVLQMDGEAQDVLGAIERLGPYVDALLAGWAARGDAPERLQYLGGGRQLCTFP